MSYRGQGYCGQPLGTEPWSAAHLQEELNQVHIIGLLPAVELQQAVDTCFQKESIIDCIQTYAWLSRTQKNKQSVFGLDSYQEPVTLNTSIGST